MAPPGPFCWRNCDLVILRAWKNAFLKDGRNAHNNFLRKSQWEIPTFFVFALFSGKVPPSPPTSPSFPASLQQSSLFQEPFHFVQTQLFPWQRVCVGGRLLASRFLSGRCGPKPAGECWGQMLTRAGENEQPVSVPSLTEQGAKPPRGPSPAGRSGAASPSLCWLRHLPRVCFSPEEPCGQNASVTAGTESPQGQWGQCHGCSRFPHSPAPGPWGCCELGPPFARNPPVLAGNDLICTIVSTLLEFPLTHTSILSTVLKKDLKKKSF